MNFYAKGGAFGSCQALCAKKLAGTGEFRQPEEMSWLNIFRSFMLMYFFALFDMDCFQHFGRKLSLGFGRDRENIAIEMHRAPEAHSASLPHSLGLIL